MDVEELELSYASGRNVKWFKKCVQFIVNCISINLLTTIFFRKALSSQAGSHSFNLKSSAGPGSCHLAISSCLHTSALRGWGGLLLHRMQGDVVSKQDTPQLLKVEGAVALLKNPGLLVFLRQRLMGRMCQKSKGT